MLNDVAVLDMLKPNINFPYSVEIPRTDSDEIGLMVWTLEIIVALCYIAFDDF